MKTTILGLGLFLAISLNAQQTPADTTKKPKTRAAITEKGIPSKAAKTKKKDEPFKKEEPLKKEASKESPKAKTNKP
jgi:hypothetical protein